MTADKKWRMDSGIAQLAVGLGGGKGTSDTVPRRKGIAWQDRRARERKP